MSVCSTNCSIFRLCPRHGALLTEFIRFGSDFEHIPVKCCGILIDGDLAKRINSQEEPSPGSSISVSRFALHLFTSSCATAFRAPSRTCRSISQLDGRP